MTVETERDWSSRWKIITQCGSGGQGTTHLCRRIDETDGQYVIKLLSRQNVPERRARMVREVAALKTLNHANIQRYVDSNVDAFKDIDCKLYIVTEYIPGPTLEEYIKNNKISTENAIKAAATLLDAVAEGHKNDVIHRDIKPDNIIIRNGDITDPVLVDYGLSFNRAFPEFGFQTASGQHLGNRFLWLPELNTHGGERRSTATDLSQVAGLLFFMVTGCHPESLEDDSGLKPHKRQRVAPVFESLPDRVRFRMNRVFERAFSVDISSRWQLAAEMSRALLGSTEQDDVIGWMAARVADYRDSPGRKRQERIELAHQIGRELIHDLARQFTNESAGLFMIMPPHEQSSGNITTFTSYLSPVGVRVSASEFVLTCAFVGDAVSISSKVSNGPGKGMSESETTFPINANEYEQHVRSSFMSAWKSAIQCVLAYQARCER